LAGAAAVTALCLAVPAAAVSRHTTDPTTPSKIVLTTASSGSTQTVATGTRVVVVLKSKLVWSTPASSDTTVIKQIHGTGTNGAGRTTFATLRPGTAQLSAEGRPNCSDTTSCPQFVVLWQVTINVT
jgi:hypothetical protein